MEAIMQFEKENGALCLLPSKTNQGPFAQLSKGSVQVRNVKNFTVPRLQAPGKVLRNVNQQVPPRKALRNVNQQVPSRKSASTKVAKKDNLVKQRCEKYPEIETFIPYNPLDFETFDVPKEHKISDRCLAGVPLHVSKDDVIRFDALVSPDLLLMENEPISYGSFETSIPLFDDITIDLPLLCDS